MDVAARASKRARTYPGLADNPCPCTDKTLTLFAITPFLPWGLIQASRIAQAVRFPYFSQFENYPARPMIIPKTENEKNGIPSTKEMQVQIFAFREHSIAPCKSPFLSLPLTRAAKTMDTMPVGQKQNRVANIAFPRWLDMTGAAPPAS